MIMALMMPYSKRLTAAENVNQPASGTLNSNCGQLAPISCGKRSIATGSVKSTTKVNRIAVTKRLLLFARRFLKLLRRMKEKTSTSNINIHNARYILYVTVTGYRFRSRIPPFGTSSGSKP